MGWTLQETPSEIRLVKSGVDANSEIAAEVLGAAEASDVETGKPDCSDSHAGRTRSAYVTDAMTIAYLTLLGYLFAFSMDAAYGVCLGIPFDLISVSLEDCLGDTFIMAFLLWVGLSITNRTMLPIKRTHAPSTKTTSIGGQAFLDVRFGAPLPGVITLSAAALALAVSMGVIMAVVRPYYFATQLNPKVIVKDNPTPDVLLTRYGDMLISWRQKHLSAGRCFIRPFGNHPVFRTRRKSRKPKSSIMAVIATRLP